MWVVLLIFSLVIGMMILDFISEQKKNKDTRPTYDELTEEMKKKIDNCYMEKFGMNYKDTMFFIDRY